MLKNWTTTFNKIDTKQGGLLNYLNYLKNDNHNNHSSDNHKIINYSSRDIKQIYINNLKILEEENHKKILNGKGGRTSKSMGVSVVLSLPEKVDTKQGGKFINDFLKNYYQDILKTEKIKYTEDSFNKWKSLVFFNIHTKDSGSKTQFNFTFPHYIYKQQIEKGLLKDKTNLQRLKIDMSKRKYSYLFKTLSNKYVKKYFKLDNERYLTERHYKVIKKKQSQNYYKQNKIVKKLKEQEQEIKREIEKLKKTQKNFTNENLQLKNKVIELERKERNLNYKQKVFSEQYQDFLTEVEEFNKEQVEDKTLKKYLERIDRYILENDTKKIEETREKIENRVNKVRKHRMSR